MGKTVRIPHMCPPPIQIEPDYNNPEHQKRLLNGNKLWRCIITECSYTSWLPHGVSDFLYTVPTSPYPGGPYPDWTNSMLCIEIPEEDYEWRVEEIQEICQKRVDAYTRKFFSG